MEKYDTGCTAGGGADALGVFYDAGLALGNSFHGSTSQRSGEDNASFDCFQTATHPCSDTSLEWNFTASEQ